MGKFVEGSTKAGWGVIRKVGKPWHLAGIFESKAQAQARVIELGPDYEVRWGANQEGTDNFILTDQPS